MGYNEYKIKANVSQLIIFKSIVKFDIYNLIDFFIF